MPTGGGKSICFQVPALASSGICLVVTPLIALMKDQVQNLKEKGIAALSIYSGMSFGEVKKTLDSALHGNFKFLYVSPERLETNFFKEYLPYLSLNLIAVDEAHCISQWGYDFRPAYLLIAAIREVKPNVPVLALTASATKLVQADICEKLAFKENNTFQLPYSRPNLSYSAFNVEVKVNKLLQIVKRVPGTGIVYCRSRKRTREIAQVLKQHGISSDFYHAGLPLDDRNEKQENWLANKTRIIVCTNAFGMGIDKPDVRTVIHMDIPDCLESYYQEAGRAGRDGHKAYAVLLYTQQDIDDLRKLPDIRFPSMEEIRRIYQCLVNYLQLPVGAGKGVYYDFDIEEFATLFKLNILSVAYVFKTLEQEEIIEYTEQVFSPSTVVFCCGKETLQRVESENPHLTPYIKFLLRSYGGILDNPAAINEKQMAKRLHATIPDTQKTLTQLESMGIIQYNSRKDVPQIRFLQDRVTTDHLTISISNYQKRKDVFVKQLNAIIQYTASPDKCRSRFIANYFNDLTATSCGICDECIERGKASLSPEDFDLIRKNITQALSNGPLTLKELMDNIHIKNRKQIQAIIEHFLSEGYLEVHEEDYGKKLRLKKKGQDRNPARF